MNIEDIISRYKNVIVQITTPYGSGSGFYIKDAGLIVTNRHVIAGCNEVAVKSLNFPKKISRVLFSDSLYDIAFIEVPDGFELGDEKLENKHIRAGERIIAIGHPLGLKYTATQGIVSKEERIFNGVKYIQIDAAINPGNSGGPLINEEGKIVGINTFIYRDGESLGFAVPVKYLIQDIEEYVKHKGNYAIRCNSCSNIITKELLDGKYCSFCGNSIDENEFNPKPYIPVGVAITIEEIISKLGKDIRLARTGQNMWDIEEGSALIRITYNQQNGFIYNDAVIAWLPKENIGEVYEFLLRENYNMQGNSFSVWQQRIIIGSVIYKDDLNIEAGIELYNRLFKKADYYDDILINKFGCVKVDDE